MLDYAAFPEQRQALIRTLLQSEGRVQCSTLVEQLGVSEHTIRRDLQVLADEGICKRVYGGAVSVLGDVPDFQQRIGQNNAEKEKISLGCAGLIRNHTTVFLDGGSQNLLLAQHMPADFSLTVITHSPAIAAVLSDYPDFELIVLGGKLHRASGTCIGAQALEQLSYLNIDLCFPGGCALDADSGLTVTGFEEAAFKRALIKQSSRVVAGLTGDKLGRIAPYRVAACEELDHVLLSQKVPQSARDLLTARGLSLIMV